MQALTSDDTVRRFLHVGCGLARQQNTTPGFSSSNWQEIRLDIDESVKPDVLGSVTDMNGVGSESVDAIFSSHNIEHLYPNEVRTSLNEFKRVLKSDGFALITCPDLQSICALVAEDKLTETAYESQGGPIAPLDVLYGHRAALARGNYFMAHKTGFTKKVLLGVLLEVGFRQTLILQREKPFFDLWALATKESKTEIELSRLVDEHFPSEKRESITAYL
jgi:predicted SAM-dependent methyltransferase